MGVFPLGDALALYEAAAIAAAHELGVFAQVPAAAGHRMRALLDALVACGVLDAAHRVVRVPPRPAVIDAGWGRLAEVIRADTPLPIADVAPYHAHLVRAGAPAARELAASSGGSLLDLGAGAGAYTAAWLEAHPGARATVVDTAEVIALARAHLARFGERVAFVAGDARELALPAHDVALLANVLHLHGERACEALVAAAARHGTRVVVVDLDRASREGVWFALDMALYTHDGTVHPTAAIRRWLERAGLAAEESRLAAAEEMVVVTGTPRVG